MTKESHRWSLSMHINVACPGALMRHGLGQARHRAGNGGNSIAGELTAPVLIPGHEPAAGGGGTVTKVQLFSSRGLRRSDEAEERRGVAWVTDDLETARKTRPRIDQRSRKLSRRRLNEESEDLALDPSFQLARRHVLALAGYRPRFRPGLRCFRGRGHGFAEGESQHGSPHLRLCSASCECEKEQHGVRRQARRQQRRRQAPAPATPRRLRPLRRRQRRWRRLPIYALDRWSSWRLNVRLRAKSCSLGAGELRIDEYEFRTDRFQRTLQFGSGTRTPRRWPSLPIDTSSASIRSDMSQRSRRHRMHPPVEVPSNLDVDVSVGLGSHRSRFVPRDLAFRRARSGCGARPDRS
jgi:hypothetical protein